MKTSSCLAALLLVTGCASGDTILGVKTASDISGVMLTVRPADQVARCLAAALGSAAQSDGDGFAITLTGEQAAVYHVRPFEDKLNRYTTIVEISGSTEAPKGATPAICLSTGPGKA